MEHKWEIHVAEPGANSRDRIRVTLNNKANFYLNTIALKALGEPDAVQVMFDRKNSMIGIIRASIDKTGVYRLKQRTAQGTGLGKSFYATSFCKKYKIRPKEVMLFTDARVDRDGILVLDLNQVSSAKKKGGEEEGGYLT